MPDIISSHKFTSNLQSGDIVVSEYGKQFTESIWGGTWYIHYSVQDTDRLKDNHSFYLANTDGSHNVYRKKPEPARDLAGSGK